MSSPYILKASQIKSVKETRNVHKFNDNAIRNSKSLGNLVGLTSLGIHMVRVEPNEETTEHHNHEFSDEFIYILSGEATLTIGEESSIIGPGDFIGFPMNGPTHSMKNTGDLDLVYLMGGGRPEFDVCNYPQVEKRGYIVRGKREFIDVKDINDYDE